MDFNKRLLIPRQKGLFSFSFVARGGTVIVQLTGYPVYISFPMQLNSRETKWIIIEPKRSILKERFPEILEMEDRLSEVISEKIYH
jgi:hypothetical protein